MTATLSGPRTGRRRARRAALTGAVCVSLALALSACAGEPEDPDKGTNKVGKLSAAAIEKKALSAADAAPAVRVSGKLISAGATYEIDMELAENGGKGEIVTKDATFEMLRIGKDLWVKANADFWVNQRKGQPTETDRAAAAKLDGKYVKVPAGDRTYEQFSGFTAKDPMVKTLLALHGKRAKGERGTFGGVKTIRVMGAAGNGGTIDVSLIGTPYPLRLERAGKGGVIQFSAWGDRVTLEKPAQKQVVDYSEEMGEQ